MKNILLSLIAAASFPIFPAVAGTISGTLYYTTFTSTSGTDVHKVDYSYTTGGPFTLSGDTGLTNLGGADGILFAPNGNLLVGGRTTQRVNEVTTAGAVASGTPISAGTGSYHLALASSAPNALLYNLWNGSGAGGSTSISAVTLTNGGLAGSAAGTPYTVSCAGGTPGCSTDVRGLAYDPNNASWYYGTADDGGTGDFGTVVFNDSAHTAVLTRLKTGMYTHGLTFDSYTGNIIGNSDIKIVQLDAAGNILSSVTGPGSFDQAAVDGQGHLFVASNAGNLEFIDYASSGLIGTATFVVSPFLRSSLDDIAPLSGLGSFPISTPEPLSIGLFGLGLAGVGFLRGKRASISRPALAPPALAPGQASPEAHG